MWVDLMESQCDGEEHPLIVRYRVEAKDAINLPTHISTPPLIQFVMDKVNFPEGRNRQKRCDSQGVHSKLSSLYFGFPSRETTSSNCGDGSTRGRAQLGEVNVSNDAATTKSDRATAPIPECDVRGKKRKMLTWRRTES